MSLLSYIRKAQKELSEQLDSVADAYIKEGRKQLQIQGHKASGALERSFESDIRSTLNDIAGAEISFNDYGIYLDTGVRPDKVRYITTQLIPWARIIMPGKTLTELKTFLYFTRKKHKTEGIGTRASRRFSRNNKRTGWVGDTVENVNEPQDLFSFDRVIGCVMQGIIDNHGKGRRA